MTLTSIVISPRVAWGHEGRLKLRGQRRRSPYGDRRYPAAVRGGQASAHLGFLRDQEDLEAESAAFRAEVNREIDLQTWDSGQEHAAESRRRNWATGCYPGRVVKR